jgi:nucleoside-diphosphate-sugar epimerase
MKKVLVTGATGFIGYEVANQLIKMDLNPRLMVRRPLRGSLFARSSAEIVQADLLEKESLKRAVEGIDTIFHLGARASFEKYEIVKNTIVDGSVDLMNCAVEAGVERFIHASSLLVYDDQDALIDQNTPTSPVSGYGRAKVEAENKLSKIAAENKLTFAAIRLPHVYGARDLMFKEVRKGRAMFPGKGDNLYAHLHISDAARVLIRVAEKNWSGITPVADYLPATWNEFFEVIRKYYPRFRTFKVPEMLAVFGTFMLTPTRWFGHYPSLYTSDAARTWNDSLAVKKGVLWNELGIEPKYQTIYEGIPAVMDECVVFQWVHPMDDKKG